MRSRVFRFPVELPLQGQVRERCLERENIRKITAEDHEAIRNRQSKPKEDFLRISKSVIHPLSVVVMAEDRSRVAAATAAVVPFHCVICFDEFTLRDRPPVVLPCGHTYVCAPCSKRLKRCMECREPLYYSLKFDNTSSCRSALPAPSMYSRNGNGERYSPTPSTPPQYSSQQFSGPVQVPFPIPKNVVLISMMEAAERQALRGKNIEALDDTNGSMNASVEDEEFDLNRIISGMATLSGPCGTYAVKESEGLVLKASDTCEEKPVDELRLNISASEDSIEITEPSVLVKGQTVQVVSVENGVAKLARGAGYITASPSQLVKSKSTCDTASRCLCVIPVSQPSAFHFFQSVGPWKSRAVLREFWILLLAEAETCRRNWMKTIESRKACEEKLKRNCWLCQTTPSYQQHPSPRI